MALSKDERAQILWLHLAHALVNKWFQIFC